MYGNAATAGAGGISAANLCTPPRAPQVQGCQLAQAPTPVTVSVIASDPNAAEPSDAGMFTISRTGGTGSALNVSVSVSGTATANADYTAISSPVTIPAGAASKTVAVTPLDDIVPEPSETVILTISSGAGYAVGSPSNDTVTIADNDGSGGGSAPNAPSGLTAGVVEFNVVSLLWTYNADDETGFKVERKTGSDSFFQVGQTLANDTDFTDTSVTPKTTYIYRVSAFNANGSSPPSDELTLSTPSAPQQQMSTLADTAHFYAYQCFGLLYQMSANMESKRYSRGGERDAESTDGGVLGRKGNVVTKDIADEMYQIGNAPGINL